MTPKNLQTIALISSMIMLTVVPSVSYAIEWSLPEFRLTWNQKEDWMNSIIQANDGRIWVFWHSDRTGNYEIFYKTYNASQTHPWSSDIQLTYDSSIDRSPYAMQASDNKIWVVWSSRRFGNYDIFYKIFDGSSWTNDRKLTQDTRVDELPSIVEAYGKIWVFWDSVRGTTNYDIYYKTTLNNEENWSADTLLTISSTGDDDWDPATTRAKDGRIWLAWTRKDDIFYSIYDNNSWLTPTQITGGGNDNWHPAIMQAKDDSIWVAYDSGKTDPYVPTDVFYKTYSSGSWSSAEQLTTNEAADLMPSITQDVNNEMWIAWTSDRGLNFDLYYRTNATAPAHDVEIFSVIPFKTQVKRGEDVTIEVVARNHGTNTETMEVRTYVNTTEIGTKTAVLNAGQLYPMSFTWFTSTFAYGNHTISATATPVLGETNTADNTFIDGKVTVAKPPTAYFTHSPSYPIPNESIIFNATLSTGDGGTIVSYKWDFGDGNITTIAGPIIIHSYTAMGTYKVNLTITDSEGESATTWKNVPVFIHDVAIVGGSQYDQSPWGVSITYFVNASNQGATAETFNIAIYFDSIIVGTTSVTLSSSETRYNIEIMCDTAIVSYGTYSVKAVAEPVPGERDTDDNTLDRGYLWLYLLDLAVTNITPSMTSAYVGDTIYFDITVENQGNVDAYADLFLHYANQLIGQQSILLLSGEVGSFLIPWDTTNLAPDNYWPWAEVVPIVGGIDELDTFDNTLVSDMIQVKIPGDVNGDGTVNDQDVAKLCQAYGSTQGGANWNAEADINRDRVVDTIDLMLVGKNYGKTAY